MKTSPLIRPAAALSASESIDVEDLLAEVTDDPGFAEVIAELTEAVKAKLPKDLQEEFSKSDMLKSLADDARAMLAGEVS